MTAKHVICILYGWQIYLFIILAQTANRVINTNSPVDAATPDITATRDEASKTSKYFLAFRHVYTLKSVLIYYILLTKVRLIQMRGNIPDLAVIAAIVDVV